MKEVKDSEDLGRAFSSVGKGPTSGVILLSGAFMTNNLKRIVDLAIKNRVLVYRVSWH